MLVDTMVWVVALVCAGPFALCLAIGALVSVLRSCRTGAAKAGWSLVVLGLPVLGPALWFAVA